MFGSRRVVVVSVIALMILTWPIVAIAAQLTLTWSDASTGELGFVVERSTGTSGAFAEVTRTGPGVTTYTDRTVAAETLYCYRVRAFNAADYSEYSDVACGTPVTSAALAVVKVDAGDGTVTSAPAGINCGTACSASYATDTTVTLTATATTGSTFRGWTGGGCSGTGTCTVTMTAAITVTADFALKSLGPLSTSTLDVTPKSLTFTKIVGEANPPSQTVTVTAGAGQLWTTHDGMGFANVTGLPYNGSDGVIGTGSGAFQVVPSIGMTFLAPDVYTDFISVSTAGSADIVISVQVIVTASSPVPPLSSPPPPLTTAQLTLTWVDASTGELGFAVERSTGTTGSFAEVARTGPDVTTYTDPTVAAETSYCYRVRAFSAVEYSAYSDVACATPAAAE